MLIAIYWQNVAVIFYVFWNLIYSMAYAQKLTKKSKQIYEIKSVIVNSDNNIITIKRVYKILENTKNIKI